MIVVGLSARYGVVLWAHPFSSPYTHAITPIAHAGRIIVGAQNMGIRALRPRRQEAEWVVETEWRNDEVSPGMTNPVRGRRYPVRAVGAQAGKFFALDANTGATLWLGPPRQAENTAVLKTERLLFLLNNDAELIVARAGRAGFEPIARHVVANSPTWAQPAISGDRIFVKDVDTLTLWTVTAAGSLTPGPRYPMVLLVVQDGVNLTPDGAEANQNFKLVSWQHVGDTLRID